MIVLPWPDSKLTPNARWSPDEDQALTNAWEAGLSRQEIASLSGRSVGSIANRAMRLGVSAPRTWTQDEIECLRDAYCSAPTSEELGLAALSLKLNRSQNAIIVKAGRLGLTDAKRKGVIRRRDTPKYATLAQAHTAIGLATSKRFAEGGHPRGMAGKQHTAEVKAVLSKKGKIAAAATSSDERSKRALKALRTKVERYGSVNCGSSRGSWKAGWREIGGKRNYYRSRWEANYARYLEWLKGQGEIVDWKHEPETFWFETIKRGVRSYLPDFRVWERDGSSSLHEVKGWMDARSRTTLKRMAKYHPSERITVIRERDYNAIARSVGRLIEGWETSGRSDRL